MHHDLKIWPEFFRAVHAGKKRFEVRRNDRNYAEGHRIALHEYVPETSRYTGQVVSGTITYVLTNHAFLEPGYCVFGFTVDAAEPVR